MPARPLLGGAAAAALLVFADPVLAQQVVANGTTQAASGTINTGVLLPTTGYGLYALNNGTILSTTPLTVITGGSGSFGARSESGGKITIADGSSVRTSGTNASGLSAATNGTITAINTTISAAANGTFGAVADNGSIFLTGGSATSSNSALRAMNGGSITANGLAVTATGANAQGVLTTGGTITMTGGSVTALVGVDDHGLAGNGATARLNASGVTVKASGNGVNLINGAGATISGGTITAAGHGVLASGQGSSAVLSNGAMISATGMGTGLAAIGGSIEATGVIINNTATTAGSNPSAGHGAVAEGGGTILLHGGNSFTTAAFNSVGLGASGAGSSITADAPVTVIMNGRGATGIYLHDGGTVAAPLGQTLQLNASNGVGLTADNSTVVPGSLDGLVIQFNAVPSSGQAAGTGVAAVNNAVISLKDLTVDGVGAGAGVWSRPGTTVNLTGASKININANANPTFYVLQTANLVTTSPSVGSIFGVTAGLPIVGLEANAATINSTGTTINVTSANGVGAFSGYNPGPLSTINLMNSSITTTGTSSFGLEVDSNGLINARNSQITTSGGGLAMYVRSYVGPATLNLTDSKVTVTGPDTFGLYTQNWTPALINNVTMSGGTLSADEVALAGEGPSIISVSNGASITGKNALLIAYDRSFGPQETFIQLNASGASNLEGDGYAEPASRADIVLQDRTNWKGAAFDVTNVFVDPTSRWTVTASSVVTQQVTNAGAVVFTAPSGGTFKTLTTTNYVGASGTLGINTFLGGDGSPSDRLVIKGGSATGQTSLHVTQAGGDGALTLGNGIEVVTATNGGTTVPGAFKLDGAVIAGPYEYLLYRGGRLGGNADNWYLRNTAPVPTPTPDPPTPTPNPPDPPLPPSPAPAPSPNPPDPPIPTPDVPTPPGPPSPPQPGPPQPNPQPLYRMEAPLYSKITLLARQVNFLMLGMFHERRGDQYLLKDEGQVWGRLIGVGVQQKFKGPLVPSFNGSIGGAQLGADTPVFGSHDDRLGGFVSYAHVQGRVRGTILDDDDELGGTLPEDVISLAGTYTHIDPDGWYAEGVLMGSWFNAYPRSERNIGTHTTGTGISVSAEGGYPFALDQDWTLEPMLQLIFNSMRFASSTDPFTTLDYRPASVWYGRLGSRLEYNTSIGAWPAKPFVEVDLWHGFGGTDTTVYNGNIPVPVMFGNTDIEAALGITSQTSESFAVGARLGYLGSLVGDFQQAIKGQITARYVW